MISSTASIIELSQNEIGAVSGGNPLPLWVVCAVGVGGTVAAMYLFPFGAPIAAGIFLEQALGAYFISGDNLDKSIRKGVNSELIGIVSGLGLKLQQQPAPARQ